MTSSDMPPPPPLRDEFGRPTIVEPAHLRETTATYRDPAVGLGAEPVGQPGSSTDSTTDVAKSQAAEVAQSASDAGQHMVGVAKDQTQQVTAEAGRQARDLLHQAQSELADQAATQQRHLADGLRALGEELGSMADRSERPGTATDLVRQASDRSHQAASWLADRDPGRLLDDVRDFARRRPGTFLALAAGAGLLAGRLTRGLKDDPGSRGPASSSGHGSAVGRPRTGVLTDEPSLAAGDGRTDVRP